MQKKFNFYLFNLQEFEDWLKNLKVTRTVTRIQQHHTFFPAFSHFTGSNHFELQQNMKSHHVGNNGWSDIGQHFSIFPDGLVVTGRSLEKTPACIYGANANAICLEHIGNFDEGKDQMSREQADAVIKVTAILCARFNITPDSYGIIYHHWFDLGTGDRHNGTGVNKTCPGSGFFGGNKVADFEKNFLPEVIAHLPDQPVSVLPKKYVAVTASLLNVRKGPGTNHGKVTVVENGSVLRVFEQRDNWLKISSSSQRWVYARYTKDLRKAIVTARMLNIRQGPGTDFAIAGTLPQKSEVFIESVNGDWAKINLQEKWLHTRYLEFA